MWSCDIIVDWADPQEEPDEDTMAKVKVLYCRNLTVTVTEESLRELFERLVHGGLVSLQSCLALEVKVNYLSRDILCVNRNKTCLVL